MRTVIALALLAGCASKKPPQPNAAGAAPAPAAEPKKESKDSTDKDMPAETKRKSDPCEGGQ